MSAKAPADRSVIDPSAPWMAALRARLSTAWRIRLGEASTVSGVASTGMPWAAPTSRHTAARSTAARSRTCTLASCSSEDTVAALRALTSRIWPSAGRRSASSPESATSATVWMVAMGVFSSCEALAAKRRWRSTASASSSSMALSASASSPTSSRGPS